MDINVTTDPGSAGTEPAADQPPEQAQADAGPVPAAPGSVLFNLRTQRARKLDTLTMDLKVPCWDWDEHGTAGVNPELWVRYRPPRISKAVAASERWEKRKKDHQDWTVMVNAETLADACIGVYLKHGDRCFTLEPGTTDQWVTFNPDDLRPDSTDWLKPIGDRAEELSWALLGQKATATQTMRGLFFSENDLMDHVLKLSEFASEKIPETDEESLGE